MLPWIEFDLMERVCDGSAMCPCFSWFREKVGETEKYPKKEGRRQAFDPKYVIGKVSLTLFCKMRQSMLHYFGLNNHLVEKVSTFGHFLRGFFVVAMIVLERYNIIK